MSSQSISFKPAAVIKQLPWSIDKKAALGFLLILVTFSLIGWLYLGQASLITSSTLKVDRLRREIDMLNQQNSDLALEIARLESISRVEERARALGFGPTNPANIRYLTVTGYPATEADEAATEAAPEPAPPASLWQRWLNTTAAWIADDSD
ncbi:MAG: septum formation initiator family protein [Anaerolineae bacterium]